MPELSDAEWSPPNQPQKWLPSSPPAKVLPSDPPPADGVFGLFRRRSARAISRKQISDVPLTAMASAVSVLVIVPVAPAADGAPQKRHPFSRLLIAK
jgi:hypothetical protein